MSTIEELRAAAETLAKMGTMHTKLIGNRHLALCGEGSDDPIRWTVDEVKAVALAGNALPALLAVVEAAEAETKHPEPCGHWYGYSDGGTTRRPCRCILCAAIRHLNEKGTADADTG